METSWTKVNRILLNFTNNRRRKIKSLITQYRTCRAGAWIMIQRNWRPSLAVHRCGPVVLYRVLVGPWSSNTPQLSPPKTPKNLDQTLSFLQIRSRPYILTSNYEDLKLYCISAIPNCSSNNILLLMLTRSTGLNLAADPDFLTALNLWLQIRKSLQFYICGQFQI